MLTGDAQAKTHTLYSVGDGVLWLFRRLQALGLVCSAVAHRRHAHDGKRKNRSPWLAGVAPVVTRGLRLGVGQAEGAHLGLATVGLRVWVFLVSLLTAPLAITALSVQARIRSFGLFRQYQVSFSLVCFWGSLSSEH